MKKFISDESGSAVPLILFIITIFVVGCLYTLFFVEVGFSMLAALPVPASDSKTVIMMLIYAIPLICLIVGIISLLLAGLKQDTGVYYQ